MALHDFTPRPPSAPVSFVDSPGERERLEDIARAERERSRMMSDTRAERWAIDMTGGSTTRRNAAKAAVLQDWSDRRHGLDPRSMEAQRIRGRVDLQGRTNEGLVDVAKAKADADRAAAAAALEGEKYKSDNILAGERERAGAARDVAATNADAARDVQGAKNQGDLAVAQANQKGAADVATINAQAARDVQAAKNAGALAVQQLQATQAGAEAVAAARAAAAQSGKPQGIKLDDNRSLVVLADGSSYVTTVDRKGNATTSYVPAADPAAQPPAQPAPAGGRRRFNPNE